MRVEAAGTLCDLTPEAPEPLPVLIAAVKDDSPQGGRWQAVEHLARLGLRAKEAGPALLELARKEKLRPRSSWDHKYLAEALVKMAPAVKEVIPMLIARLPEDEGVYWDRHFNPMAEALANIGPPAIPELLRTFKESKNERQRRGAAIALGYLGPAAKEALPDLEAALKPLQEREQLTDSERWLKRTLEAALGGIRAKVKKGD